MKFTFKPWPRKSGREDVQTFTIKRIWQDGSDREGGTDVSHLLDRTYRYRSLRELRWHLADRFGAPVDKIELLAA